MPSAAGGGTGPPDSNWGDETMAITEINNPAANRCGPPKPGSRIRIRWRDSRPTTSVITDSAKIAQAIQPTTVIKPIRMPPSSGVNRARCTAARLSSCGSGFPPRYSRASGIPTVPSRRAPSAPKPLISRVTETARPNRCGAAKRRGWPSVSPSDRCTHHCSGFARRTERFGVVRFAEVLSVAARGSTPASCADDPQHGGSQEDQSEDQRGQRHVDGHALGVRGRLGLLAGQIGVAEFTDPGPQRTG